MIRFYRNAFIVALVLLVLTPTFIYMGISKANLVSRLYPAGKTSLQWKPVIEPLEPSGQTSIQVLSELGSIHYQYFLDAERPFPYTHYSMDFIVSEDAFTPADFSAFTEIVFHVRCEPENVIFLAILSFDEQVTDIHDPRTRRVSSAPLSCSPQWQEISLSLDEIITPEWWLSERNLAFSDTGYNHQKVMALAFVNSRQSPRATISHVYLDDITLHGNQPIYLYLSIAGIALCWLVALGLLVVAYVRERIRDIKEKVRLDQPLLAYKQLSIEPQKDKEKSDLFRFMATEYSNPDLSLEMVASTLGINRNKVNELLKAELGLTFSAYLNKLRLTEAARLLTQKNAVAVSEIAYSVGYNNVSYFNKLFKGEYGCAPKMFKSIDFNSNSDEHS